MIRFAIWTAVSTDPQAADDKDSLAEQERKCREVGKSKGWIEIGLYSVPGESRTRWVNLRDAEDEMPALRQMLDDAKARLFDLVVMYDYNRLRDLLDPVAKTLRAYGVQLYSVNQGIEPQEPETFNQYASDAEQIMRRVQQIVSDAQISDLRRKHTMGIAKRVRRGLHPAGRAPYGYEIQGNKIQGTKLVLNAAEAAVAIEIKNLYLSGLGGPQIIDRLAARGVRGPGGGRWSDYGLRYVLRNPVYCGTVRLGYFRKINDPRTGKSRMVLGDPAKMLSNTGEHTPLWDQATHDAILAEMKRRAKRHKGPKTYRLSNLLFCAEHDKPLRVIYISGIRDDVHRAWYCNHAPGHWHVRVRDAGMLPRLAHQMVDDLDSMKEEIEIPESRDETEILRFARNDLIQRRERLTDALEVGGLDPKTYAARVDALDLQLGSLQEKITSAESRASNHDRRLDRLSIIVAAIQDTPQILTEAPPQEINQQLRSLIAKVALQDDGDFEISYR